MMAGLADVLLWIVAASILAPLGVVTVECLLAVLPGRRALRQGGKTPRLAVLVPAHNEEEIIARTLLRLRPKLKAEDLLLVVADNCTDQTARIAREAGAIVLERNDPDRRGKGFALAHGVDHLRTDPPDVVVVLDADCEAHGDTLDRLGYLAMEQSRPVQAIYRFETAEDSGGVPAVSALALRLKTVVRPLGLARCGLPCQLMGSGMAFPWPVIRDAPLADGHLVEDVRLGLRLAAAGQAPLLDADSLVTTDLPRQRQAFLTQRTRWEHGHLHVLLTMAPRALGTALRRRNLGLACLALDIAVPPLSLLGLGWLVALMLAAGLAWGGTSALPALALALGGAAAVAAVGAAATVYCRDYWSLATVAAIPRYMLCKLPIYTRLLSLGRQCQWVRTAREPCRAGNENASGVS
jgi:cellulose synthase/poly-beta-1,6-N-acetylglucosamine synthase-like glycosyltransferase